jgi:hypothetical protein
VPSPVFHQGHFYAVNDGGLATAWDARTGEVKWQERLGGRHRASLVLAEGRLYATDDAGVTTVFKAGPQRYEGVSRNDLGELVYATPAIANGRVFIRTKGRLHAVGECAAPRAAARWPGPVMGRPAPLPPAFLRNGPGPSTVGSEAPGMIDGPMAPSSREEKGRRRSASPHETARSS